MNARALDEEAIFKAAAEIGANDARNAYLDKVCGSDQALRDRVSALLRARDASPCFLESPPPGVADAEPVIQNMIGTEIGPYRIREQIGEGGMGEVYVAEQTEPVRRKVALKIIRPGMATKDVLARFESERQALAMMDHPNIARIFDGGSTKPPLSPGGRGAGGEGEGTIGDAQPYFVMELVQGPPITEYCDEHRLGTRERLELFGQVCRAVRHAHQKGIIHRDLKPSNILVPRIDGQAVPKVIDFGVAKAVGQTITERTLYTQFSQMIGTPLYMNPEQAEPGVVDVDTRSDVYSLGVLLYELLTGHTPFDSESLKRAGFDEMRRIIREDEPPRPSARISTLAVDAATTVAAHRRTDTHRLVQTVRGELDWIVMKALDKDRNRRYESVAAFASDVQSYLSAKPLIASPPSTVYRVKKFIRRNRVGVAAAFVVAAGLFLGVAGITAGLIRARAIAQKLDASLVQQQVITQQVLDESQRRLRQQYISDMNAAIMAHEENDLSRVTALLRRYGRSSRDDLSEDLRGPEWYYLWKASSRAWSTKQFVTETFARASAITPDGTTLALCLAHRPVTLLNLATGAQRHLRQDERGWGPYAAFSSDGRLLAYPSEDAAAVVLQDMQIGRKRSMPQSSNVFCVTFSPANDLLAAGSMGNVLLWELNTDRDPAMIQVASTRLNAIAVTPDGKWLAAGSEDGELIVVDLESGETEFTRQAHASAITCLKYSWDGRLLATGSNDSTVKLWDTGSERLLATLKGHPDVVRAVAFSPTNPNLLASAGRDGVAMLWDLTTFSERATLRGISNGSVLHFAPDGKSLITEAAGRVAIWTRVEDYVDTVSTEGPIGDVVVSADNRLVISLAASDSPDAGQITLRDSKTAEPVASPLATDQRFGCMAISRQNLLAAGDVRGHVAICDLDGNQPPASFATRSGESLTAIAFSPSGELLATGGSHGSVEVWQSAGRDWQPVFTSEEAHSDVVTRLDFSPDGALLASASRDARAHVWNPSSAKRVCSFTQHNYWITALSFSPRGDYVATGGWSDGAPIFLWSPLTGDLLNRLDGGGSATVRDLLFLADGTIVTACGDKRIRFIDATTGEQRMRFEGHNDAVACVAASADGKLLVSGGRWDHSLRFWRAATDVEISRSNW